MTYKVWFVDKETGRKVLLNFKSVNEAASYNSKHAKGFTRQPYGIYARKPEQRRRMPPRNMFGGIGW